MNLKRIKIVKIIKYSCHLRSENFFKWSTDDCNFLKALILNYKAFKAFLIEKSIFWERIKHSLSFLLLVWVKLIEIRVRAKARAFNTLRWALKEKFLYRISSSFLNAQIKRTYKLRLWHDKVVECFPIADDVKWEINTARYLSLVYFLFTRKCNTFEEFRVLIL